MTIVKKDYHIPSQSTAHDVVTCEILGERCDRKHNCRHCNVPILDLLTDIKDALEGKE